MSNTLKAFVSYDTDKQHNDYVREVKQQNYAIIGSGSESPLEVGTYKVSVVRIANFVLLELQMETLGLCF